MDKDIKYYKKLYIMSVIWDISCRINHYLIKREFDNDFVTISCWC